MVCTRTSISDRSVVFRLMLLSLGFLPFSVAFFNSDPISTTPTSVTTRNLTPLYMKTAKLAADDHGDKSLSSSSSSAAAAAGRYSSRNNRRSFLTASVTTGLVSLVPFTATLAGDAPAAIAEEEESFTSIAERASKLSKEAGDRVPTSVVTNRDGDTRTAYDFDLPISGESRPFKDVIKQEVDEDGRSKVKAILVSNRRRRQCWPRISFGQRYRSCCISRGQRSRSGCILCG